MSAKIHLLNFGVVEQGFAAAFKAIIAIFQDVTPMADLEGLPSVLLDHENCRAIIHIQFTNGRENLLIDDCR